jgi:hypothetical protein
MMKNHHSYQEADVLVHPILTSILRVRVCIVNIASDKYSV